MFENRVRLSVVGNAGAGDWVGDDDNDRGEQVYGNLHSGRTLTPAGGRTKSGDASPRKSPFSPPPPTQPQTRDGRPAGRPAELPARQQSLSRQHRGTTHARKRIHNTSLSPRCCRSRANCSDASCVRNAVSDTGPAAPPPPPPRLFISELKRITR